jgi:serine/threonine protein kinase
VVKLADFGASTTMAFGETVETTTIKGTPYFMAPEVLGESRYGRRGDVWAVGCTIVQMLTGEPPWKDRKPSSLIHLHTLVSTWKGVPAMDREIPEDLQAFLELCFIKDFNFRPMAKTLLEHEFLNPE